MKKALIDLNVVLDALLDRAPHAQAAAALWSLVEQKQVAGYVAAHGITTLHFIARKQAGSERASRCVADALGVFAVAPVDASVLKAALDLRWPDFEDAVTAAAADRAGCDVVVTRDVAGFRGAGVPVMEPAEAVAALGRAPLET